MSLADLRDTVLADLTPKLEQLEADVAAGPPVWGGVVDTLGLTAHGSEWVEDLQVRAATLYRLLESGRPYLVDVEHATLRARLDRAVSTLEGRAVSAASTGRNAGTALDVGAAVLDRAGVLDQAPQSGREAKNRVDTQAALDRAAACARDPLSCVPTPDVPTWLKVVVVVVAAGTAGAVFYWYGEPIVRALRGRRSR